MKEIKRTKLASALVQALGAGVAMTLAATAANAQAQRVEKIEVTGSRIRGASMETQQPVITLSKQDIERQGFTSVADVFATMRWGWLPIGWLITQRFDSAERIGRVNAPVLVVHGSNDSLIKPELGRALYDKAPGPKRWVLVEGGSHHSTNTMAQGEYELALRELFGWPR